MGRLRALWSRIVGGLWFVPSVIVAIAVLVALLLVNYAAPLDIDLAERWPLIFGAGVEGARSVLESIATSMITVAGVVFSVTIVALSLAASQYSPRVLRTFMADRPTQVVFGSFIGTFAYCLTVLRTIRGGDDEFVPSVAVLGGILLAFVGIGMLVFFIHHLAASIEASSILQRVTAATLRSVAKLFPDELGAPLEQTHALPDSGEPREWTAAAAHTSGYIVSIENEGLLALARSRGRIVRMERGIGEFVVAGERLASLEGVEALTGNDEAELNACYVFDRQRTIEQDAGFGLQQIVDVGAKALSPGINDASTALMCIDRLTEILVYLARRRIESPYRRDDGRLRVIALGPSFASLLAVAYRELTAEARGKHVVLERLARSLEVVGAATLDRGRRQALAGEAARLAAIAPPQQAELLERLRRLQEMLASTA